MGSWAWRGADSTVSAVSAAKKGMEVVGWHLGIPASEVYGAATSYTELRLADPGQHVVRVCTGLSCRVNGADELLRAAASVVEKTQGDGRISLEETACGFLCGMAPVVELDRSWRGRVSADALRELIAEAVR